MKTVILLPLAVLVVISLAFSLPRQDDEPSADEKAVYAAVEDYVLGFYRAEPERLERSLSPALKKMGYYRSGEEKEYKGPVHMTYDQARELASKWNADGKQGQDIPYSIELFEVVDQTACAKLTAKWGMDYFQLAKEEGRWRIHHVMWQSAPVAKR